MIPEISDALFSMMLGICTGTEPYRCWRNAVVALLSCATLLEEPQYVEGWIVLPRTTTITIIEHGWIASGSHIFDPSIWLVESRAQPVFYFAGFSLSATEVPQRLHGKILPTVCNSDYGKDGLLHPGYKNAYQQAWQCAQEQAHEKHLLESAIVVSAQRTPTGTATLIPY